MSLTLGYILDNCNDWELFCSETGYSVWSVNEGGKDVVVILTIPQLKKYGLI